MDGATEFSLQIPALLNQGLLITAVW